MAHYYHCSKCHRKNITNVQPIRCWYSKCDGVPVKEDSYVADISNYSTNRNRTNPARLDGRGNPIFERVKMSDTYEYDDEPALLIQGDEVREELKDAVLPEDPLCSACDDCCGDCPCGHGVGECGAANDVAAMGIYSENAPIKHLSCSKCNGCCDPDEELGCVPCECKPGFRVGMRVRTAVRGLAVEYRDKVGRINSELTKAGTYYVAFDGYADYPCYPGELTPEPLEVEHVMEVGSTSNLLDEMTKLVTKPKKVTDDGHVRSTQPDESTPMGNPDSPSAPAPVQGLEPHKYGLGQIVEVTNAIEGDVPAHLVGKVGVVTAKSYDGAIPSYNVGDLKNPDSDYSFLFHEEELKHADTVENYIKTIEESLEAIKTLVNL